MDKHRKWAGWLVLTAIATVAAIALAVTNQVTEDPIRQQNMQRSYGALVSMFPEAERFEEIVLSEGEELQAAYTVMKGGQAEGYAASIVSQGYAGPVEIIVGAEKDLTLRGISVGGSDFKETEGLGSKAREPAFTDQFKGKRAPLTLGQDIDGISGATVTSTAVVEGVNQAMDWMSGHTGNGEPQASPQAAAPARTANASVIGYAGPVLVRLTLDEAGKIAALEIGGERMLETQGVGARVAEPSFAEQFIGKTPPIQEGDVELLSGATISSRAAVEAVNQAAAFLTEP